MLTSGRGTGSTARWPQGADDGSLRGMTTPRLVDRTAGWLGVASLLTLLASEIALTLPDVDATPSAVAGFYAAHRGVVVVLQVAGFAASVMLGLFAWRLRQVRRGVA